MIHYLNSALDALEKLFRLHEKRGVFKTAFRIVLSLAIFILFYFAWQAFTKQEGGSSTSIQVVESDVRFWGELVEGTKISIRDKIRHTMPYEFEIDSPAFFDRCIKTGTRNYFSELGYSQKDIIDSKVIDTLKGKEVIGRTLLVELPLPDTLIFEIADTSETDNSPLTGCWRKAKGYDETRNRIMKEVDQKAYKEIIGQYLIYNYSAAFPEAATTLFKYVNGAYSIGKERGFDSVISVFDFKLNNQHCHIEIKCSRSPTGEATHEILRENGSFAMN